MFKLKKLVTLLFCLVMLSSVVLTSCSNGNDTPAETSKSTAESTESGENSKENETAEQHTHTPNPAVMENFIDSTCTQAGSYDEVVYCSTCNREISRTQKIVDKKAHEYNQKVTTDTYLESEATCTDSARYCYSCICGEKGNSTFTDGEANGHSYASDWEKDAIHHWHKANCEHTSEISGKTEHDLGTDNICDICEYVRGIAVSGITLNYTSFAAMVGDVKNLIATITPDDATNKKVMWTTSNSAVITVDESGVVTAVGAGNAIVYAVTEDGAKIAQCIVVVIGDECSHTTTRTERENEIDSTCKEVGSYDEVVYCSACGEELSKTQKEIAKKETHTLVIDARVEPTFTETGLTEGSHCGVCGFVIVAQEVIPVKPSKSALLSENLTVNATNISGKVSYATTEFNFANDISVTNSGTWVLSTDVNGVHTIITKKAPLSEGDNVFYIHVENPDKSVTTYTVNIYRNHMYTVSFDTDGGTSVEPQYVEEGYLATAPSTDKTGYTFVSWNYDFNTPITSNITIKANWNANTGTAYRVEYYFENATKNGYDIVSAETENLTGTTGTTANAEQKTFPHFTLNTSKSTLSGNINGDGSLVLKVYYTRNTYTVSTSRSDANAGTITGSGTYAYNKEITLTAKSNLAYVFLGWYENDVLVSSDTSYTLTVSENKTITASWKIDDALSNFEYTLSKTSCKITGVKDKSKTEYIVPNYVTNIAIGAFNGCSNMTILTIPFVGTSKDGTSHTHFSYIFNASSYSYDTTCVPLSLKNVIIIGETSIGEDAFSNCSSLTSIVIPDSVTSIGDSAFWGCTGLTSITIPDSVTSIGDWAFYDCTGLTSMTIGNGVTSIGEDAFHNCSSLTSIVIPDGVTSIGEDAFRNCSSLTSIVIPDSVMNIGDEAFWNCASLQVNEYDNAYYLGNSENPYTLLVRAKNTSITSCNINNITRIIYSGAFYDCTELTSITIPDNVTSIGTYAFPGCTGLTSITVSPENIKYHSFGNCLIETKSKTLILGCKNSTIPTDGSVTSIGDWAFYGCTGLTSITIPDSVTRIGLLTFAYCTGLTSITIGNGVTNIDSYAFEECSKLTSVYYTETEAAWSNISIYSENSIIINATRYYYSKTEPADTTCDYWHYVDGVPTPWETNLK